MPVRDFIRLVWKMRMAQEEYFDKKNQATFWEMKAEQKKVDKELVLYLEVMDRKHVPASLKKIEKQEEEDLEQASLPTLETHKQGKLPL
jgi:hypothetical protein